MSFLTDEEIEKMGFKSIGTNCLLSSKASFYNCKNISIGNNVRIDDFCVLSAGEEGIEIENYIHIAVFTSLIGKGKIHIKDFANISSRVSIYSSNDDYSGLTMSNPMIPDEYKNVFSAPVIIGKHSIVGAGSIILPDSILQAGATIGALSLVSGIVPSFEIFAGVPAKKIKERSKKLLNLESDFNLS